MPHLINARDAAPQCSRRNMRICHLSLHTFTKRACNFPQQGVCMRSVGFQCTVTTNGMLTRMAVCHHKLRRMLVTNRAMMQQYTIRVGKLGQGHQAVGLGCLRFNMGDFVIAT
eukprot:TRINITY_DN5707_c0_g1_i1.p2 TRINITY_DN5707_c0_g1~~TRINITY_DN5707_c0_g1_i1.p2  ORF type:complete len:113 (-),score=7.46 TRINITY_DN5707_c0_g1_i1:383-721(-)